MDELDVKILRALVAESAIAQTYVQVRSSLRGIARQLGIDDTTVRTRYKKLEESASITGWKLFVNPRFFGYHVLDVVSYVQPESAKADMIRKIKLIHGVIGIGNFLGNALKIVFFYDGEESRSRTVELISRITNPEKIVMLRVALPGSETRRLTRTDIAIIQALSNDARKSSAMVAKECGFSTRTVRNRVDRLRGEKTLFTLPSLNIGSFPGLIPAYLSYSYTNRNTKSSVDREILLHFKDNYLWGGFSDPDRGFIVVNAPAMSEIQNYLIWAREHPGIASSQIDIPTELTVLHENLGELFNKGVQIIRAS